ncbi:hypothetical protein HELRODRAFT_63068, partial [Helobdella robusta]|uniref:Endonuclease/exonuclease/phosphatase domain-containing protein n=1 Tax=Helobdella robusta TaxID=6412 RepID=T1FXA6_HELRO
NVVLLGDVNTHDPLWYSSLEDTRGEALASEIENSGCGTVNLDTPTRLPASGQPSSPDISFASDTLIINMDHQIIYPFTSAHKQQFNILTPQKSD